MEKSRKKEETAQKKKIARKKPQTAAEKADALVKAAEEKAEKALTAANKKAEEIRQKDREKARRECMQRTAAKAKAKASPLNDPIPNNTPIPQQKLVPQQRRQRRRVLSEDPDDFIPELRHFPSNPPQPRRRTKPQIQEDYNPELDEEYPAWAARENAKEDAEWQARIDKEFEEEIAIEQAAQKALREQPDKIIAEALREDIPSEGEKRKWTAPIPVTSHYSPRKQRKVALPTQEFSSSPNEMQIVLAGRARRQRELEEQNLRAEQSMLDAQLPIEYEHEDPKKLLVISSNSDGE